MRLANIALRRSHRLAGKAACLLLLSLLSLMLFPNLVRDYAYGILFTDGIYIPNPVYKAPNRQATIASHTFRILNLRPQHLAVRLEPTCGCIKTTWKRASVAPFGWTDFTATMQVNPAEPDMQQQVIIRTDSKQKPFLFAFFVN